MINIFKRLFRRRRKHTGDDPFYSPDVSMLDARARQVKFSGRLEKDLELVKHFGGPSYDLSIRHFLAAGKTSAALVRFDGLTNNNMVEEILRTLMVESRKINEPGPGAIIKATALERILTAIEVRETDNPAGLFEAMSNGAAALFFQGTRQALLCDAKGYMTRAITEPGAEISIRGPREGLVESIRVNSSLIRRRIRSPHLWIESVTIGDLTRTEVAFAYIKGLAREKMLREVRDRLKRIKTDSILESGYIEEFINDTPWTLFPLALRTERADKIASSILEGRVAIFIDGTPHTLIVPTDFSALFQAPDDYYERSPAGTFVRLIRLGAMVISLLLPGIYVAVITFHHELLPTALLLRIIATREGVPFPVLFEVLLMDFFFEILREAGVRLPATIGPAISIVGALILGDAAIRAGLVSPAVIIIIALTAISSFATPVFSVAITLRMLRFVFTIAGAVFGLYGVQLVLFAVVIHLCTLRSFGMPYLAPVAPLILSNLKDTFWRVLWWRAQTRPKLIGRREPGRIDEGQYPYPGRDPGEGGPEQL